MVCCKRTASANSSRLLGIDLHESRQVHQHEQQVAQLVFELHGRMVAPRFVELGQLFLQLVEHLLGILPIEPHARGARGDLLRLHQRRQRAGHGTQKTGLGRFPAARERFLSM